MTAPSDEIRWTTLDAEALAALDAVAQELFGPVEWIRLAYHHGSTAEQGRPGRDVDIAIVAEPVPSPSELGVLDSLAAELAERLPNVEVPIDVRIVRGASPVFLGELMRGGRRIFERSLEDRVEFEAYANSLWLDFEPVWRRMRTAAGE